MDVTTKHDVQSTSQIAGVTEHLKSQSDNMTNSPKESEVRQPIDL